MSSILKALKKLEQDPNGEGPAIDLWQRKTDLKKAFGRGGHTLRPRTIAFYVCFASFLAIGGWLLLKYSLLPTEKYQPSKFIPQSMGANATKKSTGDAPPSRKTDLEPEANKSNMFPINAREERGSAGKAVVSSRTDGRVPEKKEEKLPVVVNRTQAKTQLKLPAKKLQVDAKSSQTAKASIGASESPPRRGELVLNKDDKLYPPAVSSYPPRNVGKPAVYESSVLTGFSVQAIAWSKIPAERIAVINGLVVREGGFVEGLHVAQIGLDEVSLKKGDKTWLLQCGQ